MPDEFLTPLLATYRSQCHALERQYAADRQALLEAYILALREAGDTYTAAMTPQTETTP